MLGVTSRFTASRYFRWRPRASMPAAPICAGRGLGVRDVEFRKTALRIEHIVSARRGLSQAAQFPRGYRGQQLLSEAWKESKTVCR